MRISRPGRSGQAHGRLSDSLLSGLPYVAAGTILFAAGAFALASTEQPRYGSTLLAAYWLTPLFAAPLAVGLLRLGLIRRFEALLVVGLMTAIHFLAIQIFVVTSLDPGPGMALAGAVAALLSFAPAVLVFRSCRTWDCLCVASIGIVALAAIGLGSGQLLANVSGASQALIIFPAWQLAYGAAILRLLAGRDRWLRDAPASG